MFAFHRLKYSKIPIWENKRRIALLRRFIDDVNRYYVMRVDARTYGDKLPPDQQESLSIQRTKVTQAVSEIHSLIRLANVEAVVIGVRDGSSIDVIANVTTLDRFQIQPILLIDLLNQAIGTYLSDQPNSWRRTLWPIFWMARIIEWIAQFPIWFLSVVSGIEQEKVARSLFGRIVSGFFNSFCALIAALGGLFYVLEFLGFKDTVLRWLKLK